jgi:hypothetical protein
MDYAVVWQHVIYYLINVTLAWLICKLPDDGRRPKHVGAILICFNVNFNVL